MEESRIYRISLSGTIAFSDRDKVLEDRLLQGQLQVADHEAIELAVQELCGEAGEVAYSMVRV